MQELLQVTNEENSMEESETKETITEAEIEEDLHSVESEKLSKEKKSIHENRKNDTSVNGDKTTTHRACK